MPASAVIRILRGNSNISNGVKKGSNGRKKDKQGQALSKGVNRAKLCQMESNKVKDGQTGSKEVKTT